MGQQQQPNSTCKQLIHLQMHHEKMSNARIDANDGIRTGM